MTQVPLRMPQPGLVPPHQQRPPMMVPMTQPPPVSMQGLVSMAPMMGPSGGMAVMTQAMNPPDSGHDHHAMNGPYHHPHHHHPPHHPPHGGGPRPHGPSQGHHSVPPPPLPNGPQQPLHSAPPHSQYHPHPGGPHQGPHNHPSGPHSIHHSNPHSAPHSHSGAHPPHMTNHTSSNSSSSSHNNSHIHPQPHLQPGPHHMSQPSHSMPPHHSPHQMSGMNTGSVNSSHQHNHRQPHHPLPHQPMHQVHSHPQVPQQPAPSHNLQQHLHQHPSMQSPQLQGSQSFDSNSKGSGMMVLNSSGTTSCTPTTLHMSNSNQTTAANNGVPSSVSILSNRTTSGTCINSIETTTNDSSATSTREKTPMCLINELARYNKISHQYCLTDEKGPAHKKIFTVTLKLGNNEEEYAASGPSIKKAQHLAAAASLEKTTFKHPPPKTQRQNKQVKLTPTVELNALAMKRGEAAVYTFMEAPRPPNPYTYNVPPNFRTVYSQKFYGRPPVYPMFFVNLHVGNRDFVGEGSTAQQAKHNAASKALKVIKALPMPEMSSSSVQNGGTASGANVTPTSMTSAGGDLCDLDPNADLKSPISLVHEIALKRNLSVMFEVVRESGPPHMRTFVTTCIVGDIRTQGEGTGKKVSKKRAAELMLEQLKKLPPVSSTTLSRVKRKPTAAKKKSRNLIKVGHEEQKAAPEYGQGINPISRLIQVQQAKKEKEPVYTLLVERGVPRRREFVMQVTVGANIAQGSGPNKKLAKRAAAESMLQLLGYSRPQPQPSKPALKMDGSHSDSDKSRKQVTFLEETNSARVSGNDSIQSSMPSLPIPPGSGRQLVPGLIKMPDGAALHAMNNLSMNQMANIQATAAIAKELLESGSSPTAKALSRPQLNGAVATSQLPSNHPLGISGSQSSLRHQSQTPVPPPQQQFRHLNHHQSLMQGKSQMQTSHASQHNSIQSLNSANMHLPVTSGSGRNSNNSNSENSSICNSNAANSATHHRNGGLSISGNTGAGQAVRPKDHLMYLANILNLQVQFTDFPKGNKSEYLSLVSLSTMPPHVSHGAGPTIEASHDQACLTALRDLAEMGLDSVTSGTPSKHA